MKENKNATCTPCEQNFENNIGEIVKEGKRPTPKAHEKKAAEVKAAFKQKTKK